VAFNSLQNEGRVKMAAVLITLSLFQILGFLWSKQIANICHLLESLNVLLNKMLSLRVSLATVAMCQAKINLANDKCGKAYVTKTLIILDFIHKISKAHSIQFI